MTNDPEKVGENACNQKYHLNSLRHKPDFKQPQQWSLWKALWEKEKMPVTKMLSILHKANLEFSITSILSSAHAFSLDEYKICCLVKSSKCTNTIHNSKLTNLKIISFNTSLLNMSNQYELKYGT